MNEIRLKADGRVVEEPEYQSLYPNVSFPAGHVFGDADLVLPSVAPAITATQSVNRNGVVQDTDGNWVWAWEITAWPQSKIDETLARIRLEKTQAIKAERDRRKFSGVHVGAYWIHSDTFSRTQWLGMLLAGANLPPVQWSTLDGTFVTTTPTLAGQVFQAVMTMDATLFALAAAKIAAMTALADPSTFDPLAGWPLTFGE